MTLYVMSDSLTALLIDAKKEYNARLYEIVLPPISQYMRQIYRADETSNRYISFQQKLSQIPFWNTFMIQEKTSEITRKFPYFENLFAACIVSNVKVLSSIRISSDRPSIKLKLPGVDVFVHELYKQTAQALYYYPTIMDCAAEKLNSTIFESIERAIRRLIPFDDILSTYLQGGETNTTDSATVPECSSDSSSSSSESESSSEEEDEPINVPIHSHHDDDDDDSRPYAAPVDAHPPQPYTQPAVAPAPRYPAPPAPAAMPPTLPAVPAVPVAPSPIQTAVPAAPAPMPVPGQLVPSAREAF
jgi:hypothetical protein